MSWPELPLELCCNCGRSTDDWYLGDGRVVCGTCWDPFGTTERPGPDGIDKEGHGMLGVHLKTRAAQGAGAGNSNRSSGLTTLDELVRSSDCG